MRRIFSVCAYRMFSVWVPGEPRSQGCWCWKYWSPRPYVFPLPARLLIYCELFWIRTPGSPVGTKIHQRVWGGSYQSHHVKTSSRTVIFNQVDKDAAMISSWGASAGAVSVALHMVTNGGNPDGLFRAAFMESGSPIHVGDITKGQPYYDALVADTGCSGATDTLQCLREVPYETLLTAVNQSPGVFAYQVRFPGGGDSDVRWIYMHGLKVARLSMVAPCGWGVPNGRPTRFGSAGICCRRTVHQRCV